MLNPNKIWKVFLKRLWPLLWPIIRDSMVDIVHDLAFWLKQSLADRLNSTTEAQQQHAENRAREAKQQADNADSKEDRIKANSKADAWREIAEQLRKDNKELKEQLEEAIQLSQIYARKRIDSEAEQTKVEKKIESLEPPADPEKLPSDKKS